MSSEPEKQPVSMNKGPAHADDVSAERPRTVVAAVVAMGASALFAFGAAIALYGQHDWISSQQIKANSSSVSKAVTSAVASATSHGADPSTASASASASATKNWPLTSEGVHSSVTQQQQAALIGTIVVVAALGVLGVSVYRGRYWGRWGVVAFWFLASFTGTLAGVGSILSIGSSAPAVFKIPSFLAGLALMTAVVLVNLKPSTAYFALSKPAPRADAPPRRGLFAPRTPPAQAPPTKQSTTEKAKTALTSTAASRGETFVQKQRAKKRAAANQEAIARGADLARSRAKASKSRRIENDRHK